MFTETRRQAPRHPCFVHRAYDTVHYRPIPPASPSVQPTSSAPPNSTRVGDPDLTVPSLPAHVPTLQTPRYARQRSLFSAHSHPASLGGADASKSSP